MQLLVHISGARHAVNCALGQTPYQCSHPGCFCVSHLFPSTFFSSSFSCLLKSSFSSSSSQDSSHRWVVPPGISDSSCVQSTIYRSAIMLPIEKLVYLLWGSPRIHHPLLTVRDSLWRAWRLLLGRLRWISWARVWLWVRTTL